jgi:hypothetical protein
VQGSKRKSYVEVEDSGSEEAPSRSRRKTTPRGGSGDNTEALTKELAASKAQQEKMAAELQRIKAAIRAAAPGILPPTQDFYEEEEFEEPANPDGMQEDDPIM